MKRFLLVGAAAMVALAIAVFGAAAWCMNAPAIPYSKMEKMRVGMTANEAAELLGQPASRYSEPNGSERWVYSRHTWAMYKVWIGPDRRVVNFEHDF